MIILRYVENVRNYISTNRSSSNKYRLTEIDSIRKEARNETSASSSSSSLSQAFRCDSKIVKIEFDLNEPKLHARMISDRSSAIDDAIDNQRIVLIKEMCQIAQEKGYFSKSSGCHICADVSLGRVAGYIHIAGDLFYQMHPNPSLFLNNFSRLTNYYIST